MDARPQFFAGQYLGAGDLQTIIDYTRARHDQHLLAGHGWGIAAGLELVEQPNPDGSVSVWLQPGYAWDGYGRSIVVDAPTPLDATQLQGNPTGAWFVWLAYGETLQDAIDASYGVCDGTNTFLRVAEGFQIVLSGQLQLGQQHSGVIESGTLRPDARLIRRVSDPAGPFLCDANVPEQGDNPLAGKAVWLVPLGLVGWNAAAQQVVALTALQKQGARLFRRNIAAVAEDILAPGGLLRLRPHGIFDPTKTDADVDAVCRAGQPLTSDLVTTAEGRVTFDDLVWVEGNLRVLGNARLYGGELDLRLRDGTAPAGSLFLRRAPGSAATTDLEVSIGDPPAGPGPVNRLVVASSQNDVLTTPPALAVLADGRVGIGVATPRTGSALDVNGPIGSSSTPAVLSLLGSSITDAGDGILLLTGSSGVVELGLDGGNGQVGINTKSPHAGAALDVLGGGIAVSGSPAFLKLLNSQLTDANNRILQIHSGGGIVAFDGRVGIGAAPGPGLALDVNGDFGRDGGPATLHLWGSRIADIGGGILHIQSGGGGVTFDAGDRVGIGAAPGPGLTLDVNGDFGHDGGPATLHLWGSRIADIGGGILHIQSGGTIVAFDGNNNVGIGTNNPTALLDVAGAALIEGNLTVNGNGLVVGDLTVNGFFSNFSDVRLKRDIEPLSGALDRLLSLRGVEFEWSRPDLARLRPGRQVGLIADEVESVFPAWVATDPNTGLKLLSTQGHEAVVVEAVRELSRRIDALEHEHSAVRQLTDRLDTLERENRALRNRLERAAEPPPPAGEPPPEGGAPTPRRRRPQSQQ